MNVASDLAADVAPGPGAGGEPAFLRRGWRHWTRAAHAVGVVQTRILMFLLYAVMVLPIGLLFRCFRDDLHLRRPEHGNWWNTPSEKPSLDRAREQF